MSQAGKSRILWAAWIVSAALAGLAPLLRAFAHLPGIQRWPIYAAVAVMGLALVLVRKSPYALLLAITMSASGIAIGGSIGFLSVGVGFGRGLFYLLALKWMLAGIFLLVLFIRCLKADERAKLEEEQTEKERIDLSQMPPAELKAKLHQLHVEYEETYSQVQRNLKRQYIILGITAVLAICVFVISRFL